MRINYGPGDEVTFIGEEIIAEIWGIQVGDRHICKDIKQLPDGLSEPCPSCGAHDDLYAVMEDLPETIPCVCGNGEHTLYMHICNWRKSINLESTFKAYDLAKRLESA